MTIFKFQNMINEEDKVECVVEGMLYREYCTILRIVLKDGVVAEWSKVLIPDPWPLIV